MRKCKICDSEMLPLKKVIKNITYYDFKCHEELMSHLFIERVLNDKVIILKARLSSEEEDIVFKIDFDNPRIEIWSDTSSDFPDSIIINTAFNPDFSDLNKLKLKIKGLIVFS